MAEASPQIFRGDPRNGIATYDAHSTYSTENLGNQGSRHEREIPSQRCSANHPRQCGKSPVVCSQVEFQSILPKEATKSQKKRDSAHPITSSQTMMDQKHCTLINYVLCSPNFEDIVIIHPIDIDTCKINKGYIIPTRNEVQNAYFKQLKHNLMK